MRNPFRSESEAFAFLLLAVAVFVPVAAAAAFGPTWLAVALLAIAVLALAARTVRRPRLALELKSAPAHAGPAGEHRILVVANDALGAVELTAEIERLGAASGTRVLLLAPALVSRWGRITSNVDVPRERAQARVQAALARIGGRFHAEGSVSDAEPLQAIEDALATFSADEIVVATRRERPWDGLEPRLAGLAQERFAVPVAHFVLDA